MQDVISVGTDVINPCKDIPVGITRVTNKKVAIGECEITIDIECAQNGPACAECHKSTGVVIIYGFEDSAPLRIRRKAINP